MSDYTDAQIAAFRNRLPDDQWNLKHDCLVATGRRRSPRRGGKAEARRRVVDAINAEMRTVAELGRVVADAVVASRGNAASAGDSCTCGHAVEEHGHDPEYPKSSACSECDCIAYEANA